MRSKSTTTSVPAVSNVKLLFARLGEIRYRPLGELHLPKRKLRNHSDKQMTKLQASIREFGFNAPIAITGAGEVICGVARLDAAKQLGLTEVPTICLDHLSPTQVRAYRLNESRISELATWNTSELVVELEEILALDEVPVDTLAWDTAELDVMLAEAGAPEAAADPADEIVDPPAAPVSRPGDLWVLGKHRLLCASSLEEGSWDLLMAGATARMCFTDPPYNVKINGHVSGLGKVKHAEFQHASGEMSKEEFTTFLTRSLQQLATPLVDGAVLFVCMDWRHLSELLAAGEAVGLRLINLCVWNKTNGSMGSLWRSKHELVLVFKKGDASHINNVELGRHGRYRTNVWDYAGANSFGKNRMADLGDHPTVKPIAMVADAIRDVSRHGDIVLDAFMGSGTTLLAAERTKRIAYGMEIDPGYVDVAIRRWEKMTGCQAVLESTGQTFSEVAAERAELPSDLSAAA